MLLRCRPPSPRFGSFDLDTDPNHVNALFAMTLCMGMEADYASLIEKHQLESFSKIREADKFPKKLLAVNPDAADAYLTLGAANYIIGSLPAFKRFFLHFKGISGDKRGGMQQLEIAAARGRYPRPFAKILLAMAALPEKKTELARIQLTELVAEFPENLLFFRELAKLDASGLDATLTHSNLPARRNRYKLAPGEVGIARARRVKRDDHH
jgi:hypothetical protein